ncbi:MmyB family transcriptional regulator [Streptomyces mexicanus]|uniref:MmyB family transcriptional regulator n=1 Tax=Streptomyces mexicanus TaxID=178566 RepID=UPI0036C1B440
MRAAVALRPRDPQAAKLVTALSAAGTEFEGLWERHDDVVRRSDRKRIVHPAIGIVRIDCEVLATARQDQRPLVFTPRPGSDAAGQLQLLRVIGHQNLTAPDPLPGSLPDRLI